jgi:small-conductance mechanosensitive channel
LPSIIAALIIFVLGGMVAQFAGGLVTSALTASGIAGPERGGRLVQYLITMFVVILALGQLGVDTAILVTALTLGMASFALALALALGLGTRGIVQQILAGYYLRQRLSGARGVRYGDVLGDVETIGAVNTTLRTADGLAIVPNQALLDAVLSIAVSEPGA